MKTSNEAVILTTQYSGVAISQLHNRTAAHALAQQGLLVLAILIEMQVCLPKGDRVWCEKGACDAMKVVCERASDRKRGWESKAVNPEAFVI